ncbi:MAG: glutamate-5-semialdehyde dehydrogenase [Candidatus Kerfeldbacteria bacterium]|nr:glutamate-5-semialdehyde dehydrogenase [Candidatus Kerfeldbacteria bacterium]
MTQLEHQLKRAKEASYVLARLSTAKKNAVLRSLAGALQTHAREILAANARDLAKQGEAYPLRDRLLLHEDRLKAIIHGVHTVVKLPDPVHEVLEKRTLPNGLHLSRVRTPLGVIGIIYEARPNVTVEIVSLTLKTGNATVLKGGEDAHETNTCLVRLIRKVLLRHGLPKDAVVMIDSFDRTLSDALMQANRYVDLLIPRGSDRLIQYVRQNATVPVIETGAGVCHTYVEKSADVALAVRVVENAKTRRVSVCNALDTIVVDAAIAKKFLEKLAPRFEAHSVEIFADAPSFSLLSKIYPHQLLKKAKDSDFGREFLSMKCSMKVVKNAKEAMAFIQKKTSGHSEAIITRNQKRAREFTETIDAAAVYVNTSTAFTDGFEFGLGAEIGISTQKLHARGPMALRELTSSKWVIFGQGQTRSVA